MSLKKNDVNPLNATKGAGIPAVPWSQLIAYGFGGLIPIALYNIAGQLMGLIGNIGLGLSAFWLGVLMIIPRLWDAVSDPLMGHISDNIQTRWGRRRPFLLVGGLAVAFSFVLMWWVPKGEGVEQWCGGPDAYHAMQLFYILFWLVVFFTACTVFEVPHGALGIEMAVDSHERTRLFSAKSFLGNFFAMGTPWLFALANLEFFKGPGGNEVEGMRWVSMLVAAVLIPMSFWWFLASQEPVGQSIRTSKRIPFWKEMRVATANRSFLRLVAIIFTLAMGFNFVSLLSYYIIIFYIYGGDKTAAAPLLGISGTIWAITGLAAVVPLNWISRRLGKKTTLGLAILLMIGAQSAKVLCYNREYPYLILIPTILLSTGMLMFFTLGSSMLGDICDEEELATGTRSEGIYYSLYWWFIKLGTAFASLVTGMLIVFTQFDQIQTTRVDQLSGKVHLAIQAFQQERKSGSEIIQSASRSAEELSAYLNHQIVVLPASADHYHQLAEEAHALGDILEKIKEPSPPVTISEQIATLPSRLKKLSIQSPITLIRLRVVEIGVPLIVCFISLWLLRYHAFTEARMAEIKTLLEARKKALP